MRLARPAEPSAPTGSSPGSRVQQTALAVPRPNRRAITGLAGLCLSVLALAIVARSIDLQATARTIADAKPLPIAACLAVVALQISLRTVRWRLLLPVSRDGHRPALTRIAPALLVGYLGNAVLPARLGEPIRAFLVARRDNLDTAGTLGSVVLERVVDTGTLALVVMLAAVAAGAPGWIREAAIVAAAIAAVVLAVLASVGLSPLALLFQRVVGRALPARWHPIGALAVEFARGLDRPSRTVAIPAAAIISIACWLLDATTFYLVAAGLNVALAPTTAILISGVTVLGTAVPSAPGYVGTYDLAAASTGVALGLAGPSALGIALVAHAITVVPTALVGMLSVVAMNLHLTRLSDVVVADRPS